MFSTQVFQHRLGRTGSLNQHYRSIIFLCQRGQSQGIDRVLAIDQQIVLRADSLRGGQSGGVTVSSGNPGNLFPGQFFNLSFSFLAHDRGATNDCDALGIQLSNSLRAVFAQLIRLSQQEVRFQIGRVGRGGQNVYLRVAVGDNHGSIRFAFQSDFRGRLVTVSSSQRGSIRAHDRRLVIVGCLQ